MLPRSFFLKIPRALALCEGFLPYAHLIGTEKSRPGQFPRPAGKKGIAMLPRRGAPFKRPPHRPCRHVGSLAVPVCRGRPKRSLCPGCMGVVEFPIPLPEIQGLLAGDSPLPMR